MNEPIQCPAGDACASPYCLVHAKPAAPPPPAPSAPAPEALTSPETPNARAAILAAAQKAEAAMSDAIGQWIAIGEAMHGPDAHKTIGSAIGAAVVDLAKRYGAPRVRDAIVALGSSEVGALIDLIAPVVPVPPPTERP